MAANKKIHVKVWGPTKTISVAEILQDVKDATKGIRVLDAKELGAHGDETRPQPHDAAGTGAVAGVVITVPEGEQFDKLVASLNEIPNVQIDVAEAA